MTAIAVLGAGAMGSRIALNLITAGLQVTVYNRTSEKLSSLESSGACIAETPKEAVKNAEVVVSMVRDNKASQEVWLGKEGALSAVSANTILIESSTLTPQWTRKLAGKCMEKGLAFLEAPVLGTRPQAENGQLIYLIGGTAAHLERVRSILEINSGSIHYLGEVGMAATMKLAVNTQYATQVAIWAETLALLEKQGIAKQTAVEILNTLPTTSPALQIAGTLIAAEKYMPLFPIELVEKDLYYAEQAVDSVGCEAYILKIVRQVYERAIDKGFGDDNIVGIAQLYR